MNMNTIAYEDKAQCRRIEVCSVMIMVEGSRRILTYQSPLPRPSPLPVRESRVPDAAAANDGWCEGIIDRKLNEYRRDEIWWYKGRSSRAVEE